MPSENPNASCSFSPLWELCAGDHIQSPDCFLPKMRSSDSVEVTNSSQSCEDLLRRQRSCTKWQNTGIKAIPACTIPFFPPPPSWDLSFCPRSNSAPSCCSLDSSVSGVLTSVWKSHPCCRGRAWALLKKTWYLTLSDLWGPVFNLRHVIQDFCLEKHLWLSCRF